MAAEELKMSVSPICQKEGKRIAYVSFTDGKRTAEGKIPDCIIYSLHFLIYFAQKSLYFSHLCNSLQSSKQ